MSKCIEDMHKIEAQIFDLIEKIESPEPVDPFICWQYRLKLQEKRKELEWTKQLVESEPCAV